MKSNAKKSSVGLPEIELKKLAAKTLDELKHPAAIPSVVLMAALKTAFEMGVVKSK